MLTLGIVSMGVYFVIEFLTANHPKEDEFNEPVIANESNVMQEPKKLPLSMFTVCWELPILETSSILEKTKLKSDPPPRKTIRREDFPFEWVSVMVHSIQEKSFAILLDRSTKTQILVQQGETVKGSSYRVISISMDEVKIRWENDEVTLTQPKPWLELEKASRSNHLPAINDSLDRVVAIENQNLVIANDILIKHGLKKGDQIIAIGGERVKSIAELKESFSSSDKIMVEIVVLRQGQLIPVSIPKEN